jgi:hypothetical protein
LAYAAALCPFVPFYKSRYDTMSVKNSKEMRFSLPKRSNTIFILLNASSSYICGTCMVGWHFIKNKITEISFLGTISKFKEADDVLSDYSVLAEI